MEEDKLMKHAKLLMKAYRCLSARDFDEAFKLGTCKAEHLWRQYTTTYRNNLMSFMGYLNTTELIMLLNYIEKEFG